MMGTAGNTEILNGVKPRARRQYRSKLERRRIVEESLKPGASVAVVARTHGVNANQVFQWRKLYREGLLDVQPELAQLLPVRITEVADEERGPTRPYTGAIHVEVGRVRIRVEGSVDPDSLRLILEQLSR